MHCKVLDNTVLSAFRNDIRSVDVMSVLTSEYPVLITDAVMAESVAKKGGRPIPDIVKTMSSDDIEEAASKRRKRFVNLHIGECTAIAQSMFLTKSGVENYIVTDDGTARRVIESIGTSINVDDIFGFPVENVNLAGTVGLVMHLYQRGLLTKEECSMIADDLEDSTFRVPRCLLKRLRSLK